jgi:gamma-tubulin complex component 2
MSSGARTRASSRANAFADERSRVPGANGSFRSGAADAKNAEAGPMGDSESHKRSSPGNARGIGRAKEERRYEERKVIERTFEAHVERVTSRTNSPAKQQQQQQQQRRAQQPPEKRPAEMRRQKSSTDLRPREVRAETPPGMISSCLFLFKRE